jgi:hypothetical protein
LRRRKQIETPYTARITFYLGVVVLVDRDTIWE